MKRYGLALSRRLASCLLAAILAAGLAAPQAAVYAGEPDAILEEETESGEDMYTLASAVQAVKRESQDQSKMFHFQVPGKAPFSWYRSMMKNTIAAGFEYSKLAALPSVSSSF